MIFLRGLLKSGERPLFTFSGTIKRVKRRSLPLASNERDNTISADRTAVLAAYAARSRCATRPANRPRPSVQPMMSSTWFSGCGIMPSTLPRSLTMPAIECAAPLTLEALVDRALGRAIAIEHPPLAFEPLQRLRIRLVIALAMRDRHANDLTGIVAAREWRVGAFDPQMHVMADEFQPRVAHENAGQQAGFAENLKAVADAEHQAAVGRKGAHRVHHRRARGDRAAAQIIAVGKSAGHHHEIGALGSEVSACQTIAGSWPEASLQRARHVALAIDSGKDENGGFHFALLCLAQNLDPVILDHRVRQTACRRRLSAPPRPWPCRSPTARCRTPCPGARWRRHRRRAISARLRSPCPADRECRI